MLTRDQYTFCVCVCVPVAEAGASAAVHMSHTNLARIGAARPKAGAGAHANSNSKSKQHKDQPNGGVASAASTWSLGDLDAQQLAHLEAGRVPVRHLLCYLSLLQAARPQDKLECALLMLCFS